MGRYLTQARHEPGANELGFGPMVGHCAKGEKQSGPGLRGHTRTVHSACP